MTPRTTMKTHVPILLGTIAAVSIAGCTGGSLVDGNGGSAFAPISMRAAVSNKDYLYVATWNYSNGKQGILVYPPGASKPVATISNGISTPTGLVWDGSGSLFVANNGAGNVTVYSDGSAKPSRTITNGAGGAYALALDAGGSLFVLNCKSGCSSSESSSVAVYAPGKDSPSYTISTGLGPTTFTLDAEGNVYVASCPSASGCALGALGNYGGAVNVYKAGSSHLLHTIANGIDGPSALVTDKAGNLYVANQGSNSIEMYARGSVTPSYAISLDHYSSQCATQVLAIAPSGDLYVAGHCDVLAFQPGQTTALGTIGAGGSVALAFDSASNLYVLDRVYDAKAKQNSVNVQVFKPEYFTPDRSIAVGLDASTAMTIAP